MSDKKLLEEGVVRRFQTLANIKPIANGLIEEGKKSGSKHEKGESAAKEKAEHGKGHKSEKKEKKKLEETEVHDSSPVDVAGQRVFREQEEPADTAGDMGGGMPPVGDEMGGGAKGGDVKAEVQGLVNSLNNILKLVGQENLEVDVEADEEEAPEAAPAEEEEEGTSAEEEGAVMETYEEEGMKKMEEEGKKMEEALDLEIDDDEYLAEELTKRVAARLVAEMKKAKASKAGSENAAKGKGATHHTKPPKAKGSPTKGKVGTPFSGGKK